LYTVSRSFLSWGSPYSQEGQMASRLGMKDSIAKNSTFTSCSKLSHNFLKFLSSAVTRLSLKFEKKYTESKKMNKTYWHL
jgi:hypothetical protein